MHVLAQVIVIDVGVHIHQINNTLKGLLTANWELNGYRVALQPVMHHIQHMIEIRAHDVHLVHVDHARYVIVISLPPDSFGLRLHAALCTQHRHASVQHSKRALNFNREIHVARGIDDVDAGVTPEAGCRSRGDSDTTLLFLRHPVHGRCTLMRLTQLVVDSGIEQDTFCRRGLPGVNVSHDTDISCFFQ